MQLYFFGGLFMEFKKHGWHNKDEARLILAKNMARSKWCPSITIFVIRIKILLSFLKHFPIIFIFFKKNSQKLSQNHDLVTLIRKIDHERDK